MSYSYTRSENKKIFPIGYPQINAKSSCCYLFKVLLEKRGMGLYKSYSKKEWKEKSWEKIGQVSEISKPIGT
jgi:hypothetical protein